jgi:hypothetical protein
VDAHGDPVDGARIDLMSPDTPHRAPYAMVTTTTDASGRFDLPNRRYADRLVVTAGGATYAYRPRVDGGVSANGRTEIQLGDLPIGPLRDLLITAECATDPAEGVSITIDWLGHGLLHPRLMPEGFGFLDSGDYATRHGLSRRSEGGRLFDRRVQVPPGTHDIAVSGGCGDALARVVVPAEGDVMPMHVPLGAVPDRTLGSRSGDRVLVSAAVLP